MITWITENVAIGEYSDVFNEELLIKEKIDCILSLRGHGIEESSFDEIEKCNWLGIYFYRIPVTDVGKTDVKIQLRTASYMLDLLTKKYKRILVHCTAGIDRAPFVVAYWMAIKDNLILPRCDDYRFWISRAYDFIQEKRPQIIRHMEWV